MASKKQVEMELELDLDLGKGREKEEDSDCLCASRLSVWMENLRRESRDGSYRLQGTTRH